MDSINTSYGLAASVSVGTKTPAPNRFMVGHVDDPVFGKTTATAYTQFYAATYPTYGANPRFLSLKMTLVFDYYWSGSTSSTDKQKFEVYELTDSMLTYIPHYSTETQNVGRLLGDTTHRVSPTEFSTNIITNNDPATVTSNLITDSLYVTIDESYGRELLNLAMDTTGTNEQNYNSFNKFRKRFKGFAITSPNSDKIVGFNPEHTKTRMILTYRVDTTTYQLYYLFSPSQQAVGTPEYMSYTKLETDRSGTPLAGLTTKYQDFEAPTGLRYVQAGTGVTTRLDFSEVYDFFKNIPIKALSVAELKIETNQQDYAPKSFLLRVINPDNREKSTTITATDITGDPYASVDAEYVVKQGLASRSDGGYGSPFYRAEVTGDDRTTFLLTQASNSGTAVYSGYMTNHIQNQLSLSETDFLRTFELIPYALDKQSYAPDMSRSVNGFYFPPDKVKLKVYYTTPRSKE
ncbi:MAG: hypothetical protein WDO14_10135 [Bacteroidota bacterium]